MTITVNEMKQYTVWLGDKALWTTDCEALAELFIETYEDDTIDLYITEEQETN